MTRRLLTVLLAVLLAAAALPASAAAHASLTGTTPAGGAVLDAAPERVVFAFSERVEGRFGALRIVDDRGRRVDDGRVTRPDGRGDRLAVGVRPGTGDGAYAAAFRVVSADGHPVSGGTTFVVGRDVGATPPDVRALAAQGTAPKAVGTALSVARAARYLATGAVVGLLVLVLLVWAPLRARGAVGAEPDEAFSARARRILRRAALVGVVASLAGLVLQGANAGGTGIGDATGPDALRDVAATRTGTWLLASAVAFAAVAGAARRAVAPRAASPTGTGASRGGLRVAVAAAIVLVVAPSLGGHALASSPAWALVPIQAVHVAGMGAWVGGLLGLLLVLPRATRLVPAGPGRLALLAAVLLRFGPVALVSVAALTAAGTALALLQLTTLYDLTDTAYGRAVLVKVTLLVGAIGVAVLQREVLLPQLQRLADGEAPAGPGPGEELAGPSPAEAPAPPAHAGAGPAAAPPAGVDAARDDEEDEPRRPPSAATPRHVRAALRAEVVLLVAVLAATGALAGYAPPGSVGGGPVSVTRQAGPVSLQLTVDPARTGRNALHLYVLGRDGRPARAARDLRAVAVPPGRAGGSDVPVQVPFVVSGPGHWTAASVPFGTRGRWSVRVQLRLSAFDEVGARLPVRIR